MSMNINNPGATEARCSGKNCSHTQAAHYCNFRTCQICGCSTYRSAN